MQSTTVDGDASTVVPLLVFGLSSIVAGLLLLTLPETLHRRLPDTVADAVQLFRSATVYSVKSICKKI